MTRDFKFKKRVILGALCVVLLGDAALGVVSWRFKREPIPPQTLLAQARLRKKTLEAAVKRASEIQKNYPKNAKECEDFEQSFRPVSEGYSTILADLGALARKAGLETEGNTFHQSDLAGHNLTLVEISTTVSGNYGSLVQFINELQRAGNFYVLEELSLAQSPQSLQVASNSLKLTLHLKTYFRS